MYNNKGTVIIAGFPGVGKTWCYNNLKDKYTMLDSDSSNFSWIWENGKKTDIRNPEFPNNYIAHIISNLGKVDVVFVSTHESVRKALADHEIPYVLVYPYDTEDNMIYYFTGYVKRGSDTRFMNNIKDNWNNYIGDLMMDTWPVHYVLGAEENPDEKTLDKVIDNIIALNKDYTVETED